jgi:6-phosphogluconolactonase
MKFWKYGRVALALMGSIVLGMSITCCGVYTSGYMYVTGAQFNQIAAYKIDHDFGYLTPVTGSPFAAAGSNPVQEVVLPGGRFLAVLSEGSGLVSIYTIGGGGVLYFQQSYSTSGKNPVSLGVAPGGSFLYAVDQIAPPNVINGVDQNAGRGDITVFQVDPNTGKLTLITNQNTFNTNGSQLPYFTVNYKPVQVVTAGGGTGATGSFLYTLDTGWPAGASTGVPTACQNQPLGSPCTTADVFLYAINTSNGQLTLTQNQPLNIGTQPGAASTMYTSPNGAYIYIADTANGANSGRILPFTVGPGGVLQTLVGGPINNLSNAASFPDAFLANSNTNFLYVANFGPSNIQQPNSNISAFTIDQTNGQLQAVAGGTNGLNPAPTGAGPIWMAEDPTNQYLYTANFNDNTITGKIIDTTHGLLSNLLKGPVQIPTVGQPTFVAVSGRTY